MLVSALGMLSAGLTTTAWLPQLRHTWRSRSADGVSWPYLCTMGSGLSAWLVYGACRGDVALITANGVSLTFVSVLIALKMRGRQSVVADTVGPG